MEFKYLAMIFAGVGSIVSALVFGILRPNQDRRSGMHDKAMQDLLRTILNNAPDKTMSIQQIKVAAKIETDSNPKGATRYIRNRLIAIRARPIPNTKPELWTLKKASR